MTREEKQKAIDTLKISAPVRAMTEEEFNDYIQTINQIMDWLEQEPCEKTQMVDKSNFSQEQYRSDLQSAYDCGKASVAPCEDAISRQAVIDICDKYDGQGYVWTVIRGEVEQLPSVTPQLKTGHWIATDEEPHEDYECDKCGYTISTYTANIEPHTEYKYCPNCGAKMEVD